MLAVNAPELRDATTTPADERDSWRTPPWLFRFLETRFGQFDVDLAADQHNALVSVWISREENALGLPWAPLVHGFCNPPYSDITPWVEKAIAEAANGFSTTMVLPTHRNQRWAALSRWATERIEFEGRINFLRPDGALQKGNAGGTQVLHFRAYDLGYTRTVWVSAAEAMRQSDV